MPPHKLTLEQRIFMYDTYVKTDSCKEVCRQFLEQFPGVPVPHRETVRQLVLRLRETGSLNDRIPKRERSVLTEQNLDEIGVTLERSPKKSLRRVSQEIGVSRSSAHRATKLLKLNTDLNMDDVKLEPDSDGDSASPPHEPQFVNIKEEHMADDDNTDETSEIMKSDDELSDTPDEDMPEAFMFPIVRIEYHAVDKSQRGAPDEVKEEPWHVPTIKEEKKDEVTTEEHQVSLDSNEPVPVIEDHCTTSLVMNVGKSVERECEFNGVTDPLLLPEETDGGCSSKLLVYSGSEKNNCHKCEINNKEALSHSDDKPFRYEIYETGFSKCSKEVAHTQINSDNKPSKCEVCNNSLPKCKCVCTPALVDVSDKPFKCGQCNRSFSRHACLVAHSRTHTGDKPFKCNLCNKRFSHHAYLVTHSSFHTGERPKCDLCNKSFSSRPCLVTHIRIHTGEKPFKCKVCTKCFTSSSQLVTHSRNHNSEKTFKCEVCDKSFKHRSNFVRHSRIHTGETPFNCKACNKSFKQSQHLKVHLRTHSGEKPFKCKECTRSFTCSANLVVHSRIHNDERPFKCEVCNKSFRYRDGLVFHSRIHTGEKPFKCDVCNKSFTRNSNFLRHSRIHTGERRFK